MRLAWKILWFVGAVTWGAQVVAAPMNTMPALFYSQDNLHFTPFDAVESRQKVREYYNYYRKSGHPTFGNTHNTATSAIYWDDKRDQLSLILISGAPPRRGRTGDSGQITYRFRSLPVSTYLGLADDKAKFHYEPGHEVTKAIFNYREGTDGLVFAGLSDISSFKMRIQVSTHKGVRNWRLVDGDVTDDGQFLSLDLSKPLWIRVSSLSGPPVPPIVPPVDDNSGGSGTTGGDGGNGDTASNIPEPGAGAAVLAALALFARRPRR
jgi:hypothetical protein